MKLGFLGTGTIASAVVRGLAGEGHRVTVSERSATVSAALAEAYPDVVVADNQSVIDASDVVFVGLLPEAAPAILQSLRFREGQQVISFMAGVTMGEMSGLVAPATASALMLPFPGIAQGNSPVLAMGDTDLVASLFSPANAIFPVNSPDELDAYVCAQAVLSPAVALVGAAGRWMAAKGVDSEAGEAFLRALVGSSLLTSECAPMIEALNTPGGYNQRLRQHMERTGMAEALAEGLDGLAKP